MTTSRADTRQVRRQERGRRRMAEILDAAEVVIGEVGFEDATTNAIATRAGVSPGSLYQFFGNKDAILDGLLERYTHSSREFWDHHLAPEAAALELEELIDRVLGALTAFKSQRPAFWVLFHGSAASAKLEDVANEVRSGIAARLRELFRLRAPDLTEGEVELLASVTIATVRGLFPVIMDAPPERRPLIVTELKRLLAGYLGPAVGYGAVTEESQHG